MDRSEQKIRNNDRDWRVIRDIAIDRGIHPFRCFTLTNPPVQTIGPRKGYWFGLGHGPVEILSYPYIEEGGNVFINVRMIPGDPSTFAIIPFSAIWERSEDHERDTFMG